MQYQVEYN